MTWLPSNELSTIWRKQPAVSGSPGTRQTDWWWAGDPVWCSRMVVVWVWAKRAEEHQPCWLGGVRGHTDISCSQDPLTTAQTSPSPSLSQPPLPLFPLSLINKSMFETLSRSLHLYADAATSTTDDRGPARAEGYVMIGLLLKVIVVIVRRVTSDSRMSPRI